MNKTNRICKTWTVPMRLIVFVIDLTRDKPKSHNFTSIFAVNYAKRKKKYEFSFRKSKLCFFLTSKFWLFKSRCNIGGWRRIRKFHKIKIQNQNQNSYLKAMQIGHTSCTTNLFEFHFFWNLAHSSIISSIYFFKYRNSMYERKRQFATLLIAASSFVNVIKHRTLKRYDLGGYCCRKKYRFRAII